MEQDTKPPAERYRFGPRDARGRYPVYVDRADSPTGHVHRWRGNWYAQGLDEFAASTHKSRADAARRLVGMVDIRARVARTRAARQGRTQVPEGWTLAPWAAVEDMSTVRPPVRVRYVYSSSNSPTPAESWQWGRPVALGHVERLDNGCVIISGTQEGTAGPYVLLLTAHHAAIGAIIPTAAEPVHGVQCFQCGSDRVAYTVRDWAVCLACGKGQTQGDAMRCRDYCEHCEAHALDRSELTP